MNIPENVRALIFDCDGTLVDSMPLHWQAWHETFKAWNVTCPDEFLRSQAGSPINDILQRFNEKFSCHIPVPDFVREKHRRSQELLHSVKPILPVVAVVHEYHGKMPLAVASGGSRINVDLSLKTIGLDGYFDTIVTSDDPVPGKPAPDIFLEAARRIGVAPGYCHVFEDSVHGVEAAEKAGMTVTDITSYL